MASSDSLRTAISGMAFGSALTASGVWQPDTIIGQMRFADFAMLQSFLVASASSAVLIYLFRRNHLLNVEPRTGSHLGLLAPYDGNVIGGALVGCGMALTGACPGTVLVQFVTGIPSGRYVFAGAILGGIIYSGVRDSISKPGSQVPVDTHRTVMERYQLDYKSTLGMFEVTCVTIIAAALLLTPGQTNFHPIVGGLYISLAQLAALSLMGRPVGVSTAYEQLGQLVWSSAERLRGNVKVSHASTSTSSIVFSAGLMLGALVVTRVIDAPMGVTTWSVGPLWAVLSGVMLSLGARVGGGCTSGHGISEMSMFSISSIITVASMFGGGMALAALLR